MTSAAPTPTWIPTTIDELLARLERGEWPRIRAMADAAGPEQIVQGRVTKIENNALSVGLSLATMIVEPIGNPKDAQGNAASAGWLNVDVTRCDLTRREAWVWSVPATATNGIQFTDLGTIEISITADTKASDLFGCRFSKVTASEGADHCVVAEARQRMAAGGTFVDLRDAARKPAEYERVEINMNRRAHFVLTEHGAEKWNEWRASLGLLPRQIPTPIAAGLHSAPLWEVAQILGPSMYNGARPVFESNVITIDLEDWTDRMLKEHESKSAPTRPSHRAFTLTAETLALARLVSTYLIEWTHRTVPDPIEQDTATAKRLLVALKHAEGIPAADLRKLAKWARSHWAAQEKQDADLIEIIDRLCTGLALDEMPLGSVEVIGSPDPVGVHGFERIVAEVGEKPQKDIGDRARYEVDRLAFWIMTNIPGEPSLNEGAVSTAIRLLGCLKSMTRKVADLEDRAKEAIAVRLMWERLMGEAHEDIANAIEQRIAYMLIRIDRFALGLSEAETYPIAGTPSVERIITNIAQRLAKTPKPEQSTAVAPSLVDKLAAGLEFGPFVVHASPQDDLDGTTMLVVHDRGDSMFNLPKRVFAITRRTGDTWSKWTIDDSARCLVADLSLALLKIDAISRCQDPNMVEQKASNGFVGPDGLVAPSKAFALVDRLALQYGGFRQLAERTTTAAADLSACESLIRRGFERLIEVDPEYVESLRRRDH